MDKSWIDEKDRFSCIYVNGVESFLKFSLENGNSTDNKILCPCNGCRNTKRKSFLEVKRDLHVKGFCIHYKEWIYHGETKLIPPFPNRSNYHQSNNSSNSEDNNNLDSEDNNGNDIERIDELFEMIGEMRDAEPEHSYDSDIENFERLLSDVKRELYPGCKKYSLLSFIVKLLHIKVMNRMTDKTMNMILELIKNVLPEGNILPASLYWARKLLSGIGLGYTKIDVCKYDCAIYWKENEQKESCPVCNEPRWKYNDGKRTPHKILRYFPLKPRLQRLFMSSKTSSEMRWHAEKHIHIEGSLSHPADSLAWKDFDVQHPNFALDTRNIRLGLATDGFNPFGNMSSSYSMWPIIVIPYNLPLYKCMKNEFFMMPLLIPGPQAPGKDIDVFLRPLIDELKELWNGVETYDACSKEPFQMRAALMWTINDFPALSNLFGWSTKGYVACPCCLYDTDSRKLRSKICYMGHRRYLDNDHPYRKSKLFDGKPDTRSRPTVWTGEDILLNLNDLELRFDKLGKHPSKKKRKRIIEEGNWVKKSIFFELPYWHKLKLRHNLDVMHVEKNICDNVLGTLLNIEGKTKNTEKAREDLRDLNIRKELHLQKRGNSIIKPKACYNLSPSEKKGFCEFLKSIKYPDGYAANISKCVKDTKISGLKSHDCHILLQRLILLAFEDI